MRKLMIRRACMAILLLILLITERAASAKQPSAEPMLRVETGMHLARITEISVDAKRQLLLTVSFDKTARLWSLRDGKPTTVLRPPIGGGDEGKLYTGALSPDGKLAAVAGWTGYEWDQSFSVYLFETSSGRMVRRLPKLG